MVTWKHLFVYRQSYQAGTNYAKGKQRASRTLAAKETRLAQKRCASAKRGLLRGGSRRCRSRCGGICRLCHGGCHGHGGCHRLRAGLVNRKADHAGQNGDDDESDDDSDHGLVVIFLGRHAKDSG